MPQVVKLEGCFPITSRIRGANKEIKWEMACLAIISKEIQQTKTNNNSTNNNSSSYSSSGRISSSSSHNNNISHSKIISNYRAKLKSSRTNLKWIQFPSQFRYKVLLSNSLNWVLTRTIFCRI